MYGAGLPDTAAGRPRPPGAAGPAGGLQGPGNPRTPPPGGQVQPSDFHYGQTIHKTIPRNLEGAARCAGLLLSPAEGFRPWARLVLPFVLKKRAFYAFFFAYFRPFLVCSGNLINFK